jgi:hypothetical protein
MGVVVGLVIAFVLVAVLSNRATRRCRWRRDIRQDRDSEIYWVCMNCGAVDWTRAEKAPNLCKLSTLEGK